MKNKWHSSSNNLQLLSDLKKIFSGESAGSLTLFTISGVTGSLLNVRGSHSHSLGIGPGGLDLSGWARESNPAKQYLSHLCGS